MGHYRDITIMCWYKCTVFWENKVKLLLLNPTLIISFSNYQLNAQFLYSSTICMLHYDPLHVSSSTLLILRRTNCITTASGVVTLCKQPYRMQVESGLQPALHLHTVRLFVEWRYQRLWWYNLSSWGWAACCSKHVEDRSVTYILLKNKRIVH